MIEVQKTGRSSEYEQVSAAVELSCLSDEDQDQDDNLRGPSCEPVKRAWCRIARRLHDGDEMRRRSMQRKKNGDKV